MVVVLLILKIARRPLRIFVVGIVSGFGLPTNNFIVLVPFVLDVTSIILVVVPTAEKDTETCIGGGPGELAIVNVICLLVSLVRLGKRDVIRLLLFTLRMST